MKILSQKFFNRPAPVVAEDLLGKYLVREIKGKRTAHMITETEAYFGHDDLASHASKGRTKRTEVMFGQAGIFYIYLVYGMYEMLNVVTGKDGHPGAVLIRAVENISGPGRLTKTLHIGRKMNTLPATSATGLWFEDRGEKADKKHIQKTSRLGVKYAGPIWSQKPWRFVYEL